MFAPAGIGILACDGLKRMGCAWVNTLGLVSGGEDLRTDLETRETIIPFDLSYSAAADPWRNALRISEAPTGGRSRVAQQPFTTGKA